MKQVFYLVILFAVACTNRQATVAIEETQDSIIPHEVTILADLPDSLQPKTIRLDTMPSPTKIIIPKHGKVAIANRIVRPPEKHYLPVLKDKNGNVIKNKAGDPFVLGIGGIGHFKNLTTKDGLTMDGVTTSFTDRKGNIWIASAGGGVACYDGVGIKNYTIENGLTNNVVACFTEDKEGNIWMGSEESMVTCYNGRSFRSFSLAKTKSNGRVNAILQDSKGNMWFGTSLAGLFIDDGDTIINHTAIGIAANHVKCLNEDSAGNIWIGTRGGLFCYTGKRFNSYFLKDGLPSMTILSIETDEKHNVWIGTTKGVCKYDGKVFTAYTETDGMPQGTIYAIKKDSKNNLWFAHDRGVSKYEGSFFTTFTKSEGLAGELASSLTEDKAGNIWIGTQTAGVGCYYGNAFTYFNHTLGLPDKHVYCIAEDSAGNICFGSYGAGVYVYDSKSFTVLGTDQGLQTNFIHSIYKNKSKKLLIGGGVGVDMYNGHSFTNFRILGNAVLYISEGSDNNIWFATSVEGISKFDGNTITRYTAKQGLADNFIYGTVQDDEGNMWFTSAGNGVSYFNGSSFINYTTAQGLPHNYTFCSAKDKAGNIWLGTSNGVAFVSAENIKKLSYGTTMPPGLFKNFNKADGLPDNFIVQLLCLQDGKMAIGTNNGIAVFNISEDHNRLTDLELYNTSTGYSIKDINGRQNCLFEDSKGVLWGGTGSGENLIVRLDRSKVHRDTTPPTVVIRDLKINSNPVCWSFLKTAKNIDSNTTQPYITEEVFKYGRKMNAAERDSIKNKYISLQFDSLSTTNYIPQNLVLPYEFNEVTIDYGAIEPGRPFMVNYQHFLEGYDREWSQVTKNTGATFGNISAGTYTFMLKAQSPDGIWSEPTAYTFKVLPPWWGTWWFRTLIFLVIAGILYAIYRWRLNQVLKVERMRNSIAQDLHDEVGSTLSSVSLYVAVARKTKETLPPKTAGLLDKISKSTTKMMEGMNDIVWATKADNDTFEQVTNRMRAFAVNVTEAKDILLKFDVDKGVEKVKVNMNQRKNIYLLYKEVINNAIKHADCKHMEIVLSLANKKLGIIIKDDGKGFNLNEVQNITDNLGGNGIKGMQERAKQIGAKLDIDSIPGKGTTVSLSLSL